MATKTQIDRLRGWGYPGDAAKLTTDEARNAIFAARQWAWRNLMTIEEVDAWNDAYMDLGIEVTMSENTALAAKAEVKRRRYDGWEDLDLAGRIARRRSEGLAHLIAYASSRIRHIDDIDSDALAQQIRSLLTQMEWDGVTMASRDSGWMYRFPTTGVVS
jgi:hypothetical protein